jgi:raffinose/stachyose/melibiose transport system substrate-binding protein
MNTRTHPRRLAAALVGVVAAIALAGCSVSSLGGGDGDKVTIRFMNYNSADAVKYSNALIKGFQKENPDITVKLDPIPSGTDGANIVKTRLSSGDMDEVFAFNSGSLFQATRPDQYLVPLDDEPWMQHISKAYLPAVSTDKGVYGAPTGGNVPGGIVYNKKIYAQLGLEVPKDWAEFESNNEKIKASGIAAPVEQTYGDSWTAQLLILADFANVSAAEPGWADDFTANKAKYVDQPAYRGWEHLQEAHDKGWLNADFASATYDDGVRAVATGTAAHYPMLSGVISAVEQNYPDNIDDIGMFALPAPKAADTRLTLFLPGGFFIPKTATGAKLDAAKKFVAFTQSKAGCDVLVATGSDGPFANDLCESPKDTPAVVAELQQYVDDDKAGPALEFVSPIAGPNLPQLAVEVGSGIRDAKSGAELYDQDVKKQAQQLGLKGW